MKIGSNLKKLRKEKGATQTEIATFLGIRQNTYSQYESDSRQPDIDTLVKMSAYYNTSVDAIVGIEIKGIDDNSIIEQLVNDLVIEFSMNDKFKNMSSKDLRSFALNVIKDEITKQIIKK
mgnify:CR=1 FL=1